MLKRIQPRSLVEELATAEEYAKGGCDLVSDIIATKLDFYGRGFSIRVSAENKNYKREMNARIEQLIREHEVRRIQEELMSDYCATTNCILQWKVDDRELVYVTTLAPSTVKYQRTAGFERLEVKIPETTRKRIQAALLDKKLMAEIKATFPTKYIEAVKNGEQYVELRNEDGEYWIIQTGERRFAGMSRPSMVSRFGDILLRKLIIAGDWAVAYFLKRVIEHVKAGETIPSAHVANLKALYPGDAEIRRYQNAFRSVGQALRLFTNHTVKIEYPHPDPEIFSPIKYEKVEERILRWGGVVDVLMTGQGEGFSQGHLGLRRFVAHGLKVREIIGDIFKTFLLHESVRGALKIPENSEVSVRWDEQSLKDPKQVLEELQHLWNCGAMDVQTSHERLGYSHELIKARKANDHAEKELWQPTFEPRQGLLSGDEKPGRPEDDKPQPAPSTRPKPSKGK